MLSESPAVGSVHGHRVGRTSVALPGTDCERRWDPAASLVDPPPPPLRRRQSLNWNWKARTRLLPAVLRPIPTGPGRSSSGSRATPGSRGGRMSRLACACAGGRAERGCSGAGWRSPPRTPPCPEDVGGEEAPKVPEATFVPRGIRASQRGPAAPQRERSRGVMSVRCDSLFLICLYFLSSCVVITFLFFFLLLLFLVLPTSRRPDPCNLCNTGRDCRCQSACERFLLQQARSTGTKFFVFYEQGPYFCGRRIVTGTALKERSGV